MLNLILILLLKVIALTSSYKSFNKKKTNKTFIEYSLLITTVTNLLHLFYLIYTIFGVNNIIIEQNIISILVPNIITMSIFYWLILSPRHSINKNLRYYCMYLHLFSAVFVLSDYLKAPIKLNYTANLYWFIFLYSAVILNRIIIGKWPYYNLTNFYKTHSHMIYFIYTAVVLVLVRIFNNINN